MKRTTIYRFLLSVSLLTGTAAAVLVTSPYAYADSVSDIETFWNKYIAAINDSISYGYDKTDHLWEVSQPKHVREMMADYIDSGELQATGGRTYKIIAEDANSITFTINDKRTVKLKKTSNGYKILAFDFSVSPIQSTSGITTSQIETFWNSYIAAINESISYGYDKTAHLWEGSQPQHVKDMMADYIDSGELQATGGRTYKIISQGNNTVTFTINDKRTATIKRSGNSFKIVSFVFEGSSAPTPAPAPQTPTVTVGQIETFWNSYIAAINESISYGYDKTAHLWEGSQPSHIQDMMADYIDSGELQAVGGRTFAILEQDASTVTFTINGSRTVVLKKDGNSFKIRSFDF